MLVEHQILLQNLERCLQKERRWQKYSQRAEYSTMAVVNNTFLAPDFGLDQGFDVFDYREPTIKTFDQLKIGGCVALKWWGETEGPKMLSWHVMEPHMDLLPPEGSRGRFVSDPTVSVPFDFAQGNAITKQLPSEREHNKFWTCWRCMMKKYLRLIRHCRCL